MLNGIVGEAAFSDDLSLRLQAWGMAGIKRRHLGHWRLWWW
ncbi:MAG: hypothetical protein R3E42_07250 [Burkholderiaceae bacterium]